MLLFNVLETILLFQLFALIYATYLPMSKSIAQGKYAMRAQWGFVTPGYQYYDITRGGVFVKQNKKFGEQMQPYGGIQGTTLV